MIYKQDIVPDAIYSEFKNSRSALLEIRRWGVGGVVMTEIGHEVASWSVPGVWCLDINKKDTSS